MTYDPAVDVQYMQQALELARGGLGFVSPNPLVGCVLVKDGAVVGRGYHQRFGGPHAEVYALQEAAHRRVGRCCTSTWNRVVIRAKPRRVLTLIQAGVSRVVVALRDPNPLVAGTGLARLAAAGIAVTVGVCEERTNSMKRLSNTLPHADRL